MEEGSEPAGGLGRRALLAAGALGAAGVVTAGLTARAWSSPLAPLRTAVVDVATPKPVVTVERVHSAARGRTVDMLTIRPGGQARAHLPVCLLLHGLHGNARHSAPTGLAAALATGVAKNTIPPFAFVAFDGGDNYWHANHPGDDPMAMLLDEAPRWLAARGLGDASGTPFACTGVSMGGFGALLYARRRRERGNPASAVAAISPGLLLSWREMSTRNAFADQAQWASLDPLRNVEALGSTPVGIWCGTEDHFIDGARLFIAAAKPEVASTGPGAHGDPYFRTTVPGVLAFLAKHVRGGDVR